jgi:hypothetical protein
MSVKAEAGEFQGERNLLVRPRTNCGVGLWSQPLPFAAVHESASPCGQLSSSSLLHRIGSAAHTVYKARLVARKGWQ